MIYQFNSENKYNSKHFIYLVFIIKLALILFMVLNIIFLNEVQGSGAKSVNWQYLKEESLYQIKYKTGDKILANFNYCIALANLGEIEEAYEQLENIKNDITKEDFNSKIKPKLKRLESRADDILLLNYAAFTASINNDYHKAVKHFEKILKHESENVWIMNYKAMAHIEIEEYERAEKICKKAIKIKDNQYSHLILGLNYHKKGEILKALVEFSKSGGLVRKILF